MDITPARLDVDHRGTGPALVFTHGWSDNRQSWTGVIDELEGNYTCNSWSLRAHGDSEVTPPGTYTRAHALADLGSVVEPAVQASGGPVVLTGHSLGGYLSLAYTIDNPEHVRALVLVGAGPGFTKPEAMDQWNSAVDKSAAKLGVPEGSADQSKHFDSYVMDNMATITVPTLVVIGEGDKQFKASAGVFEKRLDVRNKVVVAEAGHSVHRKQPGPVAEAIAEFMTSL